MSRHKRVFKYIIVVLAIFILANTIIFINAADTTPININEFFKNLDEGTYQLPEHTHKYRQVYDSNAHWDVCSICGTIQNKQNHSLKTSGSWYVCNPGDANRFAARRGCECGYESKSIIVVHGRLDDYKNENAGISNSSVTFKNIEKISYAEFKSHYVSGHGTTNNGNNVTYTFGNFEKGSSGNYVDTDLGYVFSGGPIGSDVNKNGTLGRLGISTSNDDYPELRTLVKFFERVPNGTKDDFVKLLETPFTSKVTISTGIELYGFQYNNINDSRHTLYGLINKYKSPNVTNDQFEKLREELSGYTEHISSAGWRSDFIFCNHRNSDIPSNKGCHANSGDFVSYYWNHGCSISGKDMDTNAANITYCDMCGGKYPAYSCEQFQGPMIDLKGKETGYQIVSAPSSWTIDKANNTITMRKSEKTNGYDWQNSSMSWGWFSSEIMCISPHWGASDKPNTNTAELRFGIYYPYADNKAPINTKLDIKYPSNGNKLPNTCLLNVEFTDADDSRENYAIYQVYEDANCTKLIKGLDNDGKEIDTFTTVKTGGSGSNGSLGVQATYTSSTSLLLEITNNKTIYVRARDKVGNWSEPKPVEVQKVDSIAPQVESKVAPSGWQKSKTITYKIYDLFGEQFTGITGDDTFDWKDTSFTNDQYSGTSDFDNRDTKGSTREYIIGGNIGENGRDLIFYAKDGNGNLQSVKVNINKLDNTSPTITSLKKVSLDDKYLKIKVNAHDEMIDYVDKEHPNETMEGSGVEYYMFTTTNNEPKEDNDNWQEDSTLSIPNNGTYYVWCKDAVGNISSPKTLVVNHYKEKSESNDQNNTVNYELVNNKNESLTDSDYYGENQSNENYNHHYIGYINDKINDSLDEDGCKITSSSPSDDKTVVDIYYRSINYTIHYDGNTNTDGTMSDTDAKYNKPFSLPELGFKKEYIYKLDTNGGTILEDKDLTSLTETWTFKNWLFANGEGNPTPNRLHTQNYDNKATISKAISIKDVDKVTLQAQWEKGTITLPTVERIGYEFIGWFNVPQNEETDYNNMAVYKIGDGGDHVTIEGTLRNVFSSKDNMTLYAWYDRKPIFINIYDGLFFEGQTVSYADLLEMIGVWDYDKKLKTLANDKIDEYFKDLIKSIDDDINDARNDIKYIIEDMADAKEDGDDTSSYTEDIKELREYLKELLAERDKIKEAYKKAKDELKDIELIPTIAGIEYLGSSNDIATSSNATPKEDMHAPNHDYEGKYIVDYHTDDLASNGIKKVDMSNYDKGSTFIKDNFLDTCSNNIGYVKVTYQVYNEPIKYIDWNNVEELENDLTTDSDDSEASENSEDDIEALKIEIPNSDIAIEYTRTYQINFNYNPTLRLQNMLYYSDSDFVPDDMSLSEFVKSRQALYDPEDLQDNLPWWSAGDDNENKLLHHDENSKSKDRLQGTIELIGIKDITFDTDYENKHGTEVENFKTNYEIEVSNNIKSEDVEEKLNEIYKLKDDNIDLFYAIKSISLTFDGHDQFGKYASNNLLQTIKDKGVYTNKRPKGYIAKFNGGYNVEYKEEYDTLIYQSKDERTVNLILVNTQTDNILLRNRVLDRIRYISSKYMDTLNEKSWWFNNSQRLNSIFNKNTESVSKGVYEGTYKDSKGKEVKVKVTDYTD